MRPGLEDTLAAPLASSAGSVPEAAVVPGTAATVPLPGPSPAPGSPVAVPLPGPSPTPGPELAPARTATAPGSSERAAPGPGLVNGQQLGHFRIERPLGAGGMGEVYLATDLALVARSRSRCCRPTSLAIRCAAIA